MNGRPFCLRLLPPALVLAVDNPKIARALRLRDPAVELSG
jgi:hypothetical protein